MIRDDLGCPGLHVGRVAAAPAESVPDAGDIGLAVGEARQRSGGSLLGAASGTSALALRWRRALILSDSQRSGSAAVAAAAMKIVSFLRTASALLIGRGVSARRSCEHAPAIGQHHAAGVGGFRTVLGERPFDRDLVALLQGILAPALLQQHGNRAQLEVPIGDLAVGVPSRRRRIAREDSSIPSW